MSEEPTAAYGRPGRVTPLADGLWMIDNRRNPNDFPELTESAFAQLVCGPRRFDDTVGIGCYRIDLHPSASGAHHPDLSCWPLQIPLGALIPVRVEHMLEQPGKAVVVLRHYQDQAVGTANRGRKLRIFDRLAGVIATTK